VRSLDLIVMSLVCAALVSCNGDPAGAGSPGQVREPKQQQPSRLCLSIELPRERVLLGEPAHAAAVLLNCSDEPIKLRDLLAPDCNLLQVEVDGPGGTTRPWRSPILRECRGSGYVMLEPGERKVERIPLFFGKGGWFLQTPGGYRIRALYPVDTGGRIHSRDVVLTVQDPRNEREAAAARAFMQSRAAMAFVLGPAKEPSDELLALAIETAGTAVGDFAELGVALQHARGPDCTSEIGELQRAATSFRDPLYAAEAARSGARCLRESGDEGGAAALLSAFQKSQSDSTWRAAAE
jgi:hypothetical protein